MTDYSAVHATFWSRGTGRRLRGHPHAQVIALYLMTSSHSSIVGIFPIALPVLCHETGLSPEQAREGLSRCAEAGFCEYDDADELMWVPNRAEYQVGPTMKPGDKRRPVVLRALRPYLKHRFGQAFLRLYGSAYGIQTLALRPTPEGAYYAPYYAPSIAPSGSLSNPVHVRTPDAPSDAPSDTHAMPPYTLSSLSQTSPDLDPDRDLVGETQPDGSELTNDERYAAAYTQGIESVVGAWAFPASAAQQGNLNRTLPKFAVACGKALRGDALVDWIRSTAAAFARWRAKLPEQDRGFWSLNPSGFQRWLNEGHGRKATSKSAAPYHRPAKLPPPAPPLHPSLLQESLLSVQAASGGLRVVPESKTPPDPQGVPGKAVGQ